MWHERDISHSSVERVILPDSFIALDHMLRRFTRIAADMVVYPDRMRRNLDLLRGVIFSGSVLLALVIAIVTLVALNRRRLPALGSAWVVLGTLSGAAALPANTATLAVFGGHVMDAAASMGQATNGYCIYTNFTADMLRGAVGIRLERFTNHVAISNIVITLNQRY